jgi:hypothetical protein
MSRVVCDHYNECPEAPGVSHCSHLIEHSWDDVLCATVICRHIHKQCSCIHITPEVRLKMGLEKL